MKKKPPVSETVTVDVNSSMTTPSAPHPREFDPHAQAGIGSLAIPHENLPPSTRTANEADLDAILPAPRVTVDAFNPPAQPLATPSPQPLVHYRVPDTARLPAPDERGLRTFKGRRYADLLDGSIVQVATDAQTGLMRVTLANERLPSGPVLVRDAVSGRWEVRSDLESILFPLSENRLEAFRTALDFTGVEPGGDGTFHHDNKRYVVIDEHAYQVLHDADSSSPSVPVLRIVRGEDPVARDEGNQYVATRPGRSQAIVRDPRDGWVGVNVAGVGGMRRGEPQRTLSQRLADRFAAFANRLHSPESRVQKLFPSFDEQRIAAYLRSLGDNVTDGLTRREADYKALKSYLRDWTRASTHSTATQAWAQQVALEIKRCWRHETGEILKLPAANATLPALIADFSHVKRLDLLSITWSDDANTFLGNFANLEQLSINQCGLRKLPTVVGQMHNLRRLDLAANRIELDEPGAATLSTLSRLTIIDLSQNPSLNLSPDFSMMAGLISVNMNNTGIRHWPTGLEDKLALTGLDLRYNRLREVPVRLLEPTLEQMPGIARINGVTLLMGNEFASGYWRHFDAYWHRLNDAYPELTEAPRPDAFDSENSPAQRYNKLYPAKSIKACREHLWSLEADAVNGRLEALEQEFGHLKTQLDDWVFSGGGNRQRYVRANQLQINAQTRNDRTAARNRIIACWRRETAQKHAVDGTPIGLELDLSGLILPTLPDLSIDFSHVGSLNLARMNLTQSPEGFLTRFRHLRWLDMSNNRLRELPPAIGEMHAMTRLFLQGNQLQLTNETAAILAARVTLRALSLSDNPQLGVLPDFSRITDMRSINLSTTGISSWPTGLFDQPLLDFINLSHNRITAVPDFVTAPPADRLAQSVRANNSTLVTNNPLVETTAVQLASYVQRLGDAGLALNRGPNLVTSAQLVARQPDRNPLELHEQWIIGLPADEIAARREQWRMLRELEGSDGFFNIIESRSSHADFRRQVWEVIDVMTDNHAQSHALRRELFDRACEAGCTDLAAATFTDLQILAVTHKARMQARQDRNGTPLVTLSRGLFRLKQVDDIAAAHIASSRVIISDEATSEAQRNLHRRRISDQHEVTMAYRFGLKDRLQLPFQPQSLNFILMAEVTPAMLDTAYQKVIALNGSPDEFHALVAMDFWQDFVIFKYQTQFEASRQPFQDRQAVLDSQFAQEQLTEAQYIAQTNDGQAQLAIAEATLIQELTRQELQFRPGVEATPADEPGGQTSA